MVCRVGLSTWFFRDVAGREDDPAELASVSDVLGAGVMRLALHHRQTGREERATRGMAANSGGRSERVVFAKGLRSGNHERIASTEAGKFFHHTEVTIEGFGKIFGQFTAALVVFDRVDCRERFARHLLVGFRQAVKLCLRRGLILGRFGEDRFEPVGLTVVEIHGEED